MGRPSALRPRASAPAGPWRGSSRRRAAAAPPGSPLVVVLQRGEPGQLLVLRADDVDPGELQTLGRVQREQAHPLVVTGSRRCARARRGRGGARGSRPASARRSPRPAPAAGRPTRDSARPTGRSLRSRSMQPRAAEPLDQLLRRGRVGAVELLGVGLEAAAVTARARRAWRARGTAAPRGRVRGRVQRQRQPSHPSS